MNNKLLKLFKSAVSGVNPYTLVSSGIRIDPATKSVDIFGNIYKKDVNFHVVGFGKGVMGMASALQQTLQQRLLSGILSVPISSKITVEPPIKVYTGGANNLPDAASVTATDEIIKLTTTIPNNDILIVLISGGGSTLLCKPVPGINLEDKLLTIKLLTQCGADIQELNTVRKKLSIIKGGGLLNLCSRFQTICLILSDVIGNPLTSIASGPTVANTDSNFAAMEIIQKYRLELKLPRHVLQCINEQCAAVPLHQNRNKVENIIIGSNEIALKRAKELEETSDFKIICVGSEVQGLVHDISTFYWKLAYEILVFLHTKNLSNFHSHLRLLFRNSGYCNLNPHTASEITSVVQNQEVTAICLLMGGESTVRVTGNGKGGRNQELAIVFSQLLHQEKINNDALFDEWDVCLLSAGTDGIDGPTDAAGAIGCSSLIENAYKIGLDVNEFIVNNDSYSFLNKVDNAKYLLRTGHTGTNVMDLHALVFFKNRNPIKCSL